MPDNASAAAFSLAVAAGGAAKAFKTTPLMSVEEGTRAKRKRAEAGYRPPAQGGRRQRMYAVVRESQRRPEGQAQAEADRAEFVALRAQQPGSLGAISLDIGDGRTVTVALWESAQAQQDASAALRQHAERLIFAHTTEPPRIVYQGNVIADDLTTR